ncbi:MAG: glycosyltransferase [Desulfonauticus sp.]|nr:glycosyltransferase [Desulfonauticus sp.]
MLDMALGLKQQLGIECFIVGREGAFIEKAKALGLKAYAFNFGPDYNPKTIYLFWRLFQKENIDRVIVNVGKDLRTAGIAAKLADIPVIHRVGLPGDMKNKIDVRLIDKWIRPTILVPCEFIKQGLLKTLPCLTANRIKVIYTGKQPSTQAPKKINQPLQFISTSQLNPDKGHEFILKALYLLKQNGFKFHYHVVGTGRCEQELKELAKKLKLEKNISWYGFQKNVENILRQADMFILASYSEGLPNSLLEAMAEGLVCVARDVGGVREIWPKDFLEGIIAFKSTPEDLAQVLKGLLKLSKDDLLRLKTIFWQQIQNNFSLNNTVTRLYEFLTQI